MPTSHQKAVEPEVGTQGTVTQMFIQLLRLRPTGCHQRQEQAAITRLAHIAWELHTLHCKTILPRGSGPVPANARRQPISFTGPCIIMRVHSHTRTLGMT
jgi:hypothetical protein